MSDLSRRLASVPDAHLIAEMQSALDNLDLADLPIPGLTPFLGTPIGDNDPKPDTGHDVCPACSHDLELDADLRCIRCGTPS